MSSGFAQGSDGNGNIPDPKGDPRQGAYQGLNNQELTPGGEPGYGVNNAYSPSDPHSAYGGFDGGAQAYGQAYQQAAANSYNRKAPDAHYAATGTNVALGNFRDDQAGQAGLAASLQNIASGNGYTAADKGFQTNQRASMDAQTAMANSAKGGAVGLAGAGRQAQQAQTGMGIQGAAQYGALRYGEQANAQGQLAQLYAQQQEGLAASRAQGQQQTQFGGQMAMSQEQLNQQREMAMMNAQANVNSTQLGANLQSVGAQQQAGYAMGLQQQGFNNQMAQQGLGAAFGAGAAGANAWAGSGGGGGGSTSSQNAMNYLNASPGSGMNDPWSDERMKRSVRDEGDSTSLVDEFTRWVSPKSFEYRDPAYAPNPQSPHGRYLGVMAQDLERIPEIGRQLVIDTPEGKRISTPAAVSALLAGVGRLDERMRSLEAAKKGKR